MMRPKVKISYISPTTNDVLLGRGGNHWAHEGNEQLRKFAICRVREYAAARKKGKALISREVVKQVQETGGRFLRKDFDANTWEEVSYKTAREKVCQVLRDAVSAIKGTNKQRQRSDSRSSSSDDTEDGKKRDSGVEATFRSNGSDDSRSSSSEGTEDEEKGDFSGVAAFCLSPIGDDRDGLSFSDVFASNNPPMPNLMCAFGSEAAFFVTPTSITSDLASNYGDFDLFEGELLRSFAVDEIFTSTPLQL